MTDTLTIRGSERGLTGIGVLILFIALVLVAAIAAGLILDTAGFLQNTAQDTGEQSTAEVSDRLSILSASGEVNNDDDPQIEALRLTVYRSPGAGDVDLQQATIEYFSPEGTAFLIHENEFVELTDDDLVDFTDNLGVFNVEALKDNEGSIPVLSARSDRASIIIPLYEDPEGTTTHESDGETHTIATGEPVATEYLGAGETATMRITTQEGATTMQIVNVPESLAGYQGSTVLL